MSKSSKVKLAPGWEAERTEYGWNLYRTVSGTSRKTGEPIETTKTTYYATLAQCCKEVLDVEAGVAADLGDCKAILESWQRIASALPKVVNE